MKSLKDELGESYNSIIESTLANQPGWCGGNPFLSYSEYAGSCMRWDRKDKFVTVEMNGKTGCVSIDIEIENVEEEPFIFTREFQGRTLEIPCKEKVVGKIVGVCYFDDEYNYDFFLDSYELEGRSVTAYEVDYEEIEKKEKLDILYKPAEIPGDENSEIEASFAAWEQMFENGKKIEEMGYYGNFIVLNYKYELSDV